jgi:hypothetical protein
MGGLAQAVQLGDLTLPCLRYGVLAKLLFVQRLAGDDHSGAFGRALTASR